MPADIWFWLFLGLVFGIAGAWLKTTCPHRHGRLPEDIQ